MKVGVDTTWFGVRPAGVGTMVHEVIEELTNRNDVELVLLNGGSGLLKHWRLYRDIKRAKLDVLWQVGDWLPLFLPRSLNLIQTVHDLIAFDHPGWFPQSGLSRWWSKNMRVARSIERADVVHCISQWTADQVVRLFPGVLGRVVVGYQGVSVPNKIDMSLVLSEIKAPFILMLGTVEPRKNIPFACEAFREFASEYEAPHFVIVGKKGWKASESMRAISELERALPGRIHRIDYVEDDLKWALLKRASALIMTSHAEGFGRPLVEAMAVGTPVIAVANSAMEEVVKDAGVLVPEGDKQKTARAMWRLLYHEVLPSRVTELGYERAEQFSTKKMVAAVLESTKSIVAQKQ